MLLSLVCSTSCGSGPSATAGSAGESGAAGLGGATFGAPGAGGAAGSGASGGAPSAGSGGTQSGGSSLGAGGGNIGANAGAASGGVAGAGATGTGGGAGSAGMGAGGSTSYEAPVWSTIAGMPAGCSVEALQNAAKVAPAVSWSSCTAVPYQPCLQLRLLGDYAISGAGITWIRTYETSGRTLLALDVSGLSPTEARTFVIDEKAGTLVSALRIRDTTSCLFPTGAGFALDRTVVTVGTSDSSGATTNVFIGVPFDASSNLVVSTAVTSDPYFGPQELSSAANGHLGLLWSQGIRVDSVDAETLQSVTLLTSGTAGGALGVPVSTGSGFLIEADAKANWSVYYADGSSPPAPLVSQAGFCDGSPVVTGGYLAWMKGSGLNQGPSEFQSTELWAAPMTTDPSKLQPAKVAALTTTFFGPDNAGGSGWVSVSDGSADIGYWHFYHVPDGEHRLFQPAGLSIWRGAQFTSDELVVGVRPPLGLGATTVVRAPPSALPLAP